MPRGGGGGARYTAAMWMVDEIGRRGGAVPFREYMELALYHPEHGYYSRGRRRYGREGDYLTAPTASVWYPRVVARLARNLGGRTGPLTVVDVASGDGSFLAGLLGALGEWGERDVADRVVSVERSPGSRALQRERLGPGVEVLESLEEAPPPRGPVLLHASELYDARPVHRVVRRPGGLRELWVVSRGEELSWEERPAPGSLAAYLRDHGVELQDGQVAEINPEADSLHGALLGWACHGGLVLVLDYGYPAARLYDPRGRRGGSLATFSRHRVGRDPLEDPGGRDITAHVNFDDLRRAGRRAGWEELGLWPLAEFMVRGGLAPLVEEAGLGMEREVDAASYAARQEIKRILDPDGMGTDLKVLVQARGRVAVPVAEILGVSSG